MGNDSKGKYVCGGGGARTPWGKWPGCCNDNDMFFYCLCDYKWPKKQATESNVTRSEVVVNECRQLRLGEGPHFLGFHRAPFEQQ